MKNLIVLLFLHLLVFPFSAPAQSKLTISKEVKKHIQSRIHNEINVGIVVGILDNNKMSFYSKGVKSLKTNAPVNEHSVFEIGSISKTFTGTILANMVNKGELNLSDPLQKHLPEGIIVPQRNGKEIQLVNMANHTSSLPRMPTNFAPTNPANPYADYSEKLLYEFLIDYELTRDIGTEYEYSNYAMGLLGHILANKNKMSYEELMVKVIADPLGLKNTRVSFTPEMKRNLAYGHSNGNQVENWDLSTLAGAGAIRSTAYDMLNYLSANMGSTKSDLYPAMQLAHQNTRTEGADPKVGLAWHTMEFDGMEIIWHNGGTGGYSTFVGFIKGSDKAVVVLSNSNQNVDLIGVHILHPETSLSTVKPSISMAVRKVIDQKGVEEGALSYWQLKENKSEAYNFDETELNNLGYDYLREGYVQKAIAVFQLNIKAFPKAFNVYDSMGEAYMEDGQNEKAIVNYKKSLEINPGNDNGLNMLKKLGVDGSELTKDVMVADEILESYIGKYELAPGFILDVTQEESKLFAQATGQQKFPIFAKSDKEFYLKVVPAQIVFSSNEAGEVDSLTLFQNGQEIKGMKMTE